VKCACSILAFVIAAGWGVYVLAAEIIPPVPARHFNDEAHVVPQQAAEQMDRQLADFERATSNQVLVVVYPKMQSDSSIEDYTVRVAQKWGVGGKKKDNGIVLFVFIADRKMFIQVGYGLEGALPDATCKQIVETQIKPAFRNGDYAGGLSAGINAIIAATKGEYKATASAMPWVALAVIVLFFILIVWLAVRNGGRSYSSGGYRSGWGPILWGLGGGGRSWGGGSWGGGGGGGGGGFSAGGGSFGGGGAGGSW
jgi:uncharacterized protein